MSTFEMFPKVPRWNREVVITEKIDGTNSAIIIEPWSTLVNEVSDGWNSTEEYYRAYGKNGNALLAVVGPSRNQELNGSSWIEYGDDAFAVFAQSRNRLIYPGKTTDNYGFAAWVKENAVELVGLLGPGRHFGEWYGQGIARGYGLDHKRFALFNVKRWGDPLEIGDTVLAVRKRLYEIEDLPVDVVPVLQRGFTPNEPIHRGGPSVVEEVAAILREHGSYLAPGFMRPEGIVLYHTASRQVYKILLEGDEIPKSRAA